MNRPATVSNRPATVSNRRAGFATTCTGCRAQLAGFGPFCPDCGAMSDIRYELSAVRLRASPNPYRRFIDLLPVSDPTLLPEARFTPTVHARRLGTELGLPWLYLKNETALPTGTTKDRMAAVALAYLYERGVRCFTTSSTGNSSTAYAHAISRFPGLRMYVFTASAFRDRLALPRSAQVVDVVLDDATFVEAFATAGEFARRRGVASEQGFFNPGRREGLKLAWLEAVEQVPRPIDWYVQAVSSAMGVYGVFKGARELELLGLVDRVPHLLCVQQESCAPMVSAWRDGAERIRPWDIVEHPAGIAQAILRGDPTRAYPHVRRIVDESHGSFVAVSEQEIRAARRLIERLEGISPCFAAAAALAGLVKSIGAGEVDAGKTFLVNLTGSDRVGTRLRPSTHTLRRGSEGWDYEPLLRA
jgi:threonine synthase